jgi:hypothetical protein
MNKTSILFIWLVAIASFSQISESYALQKFQFSENERVEGTISNTEMNRVRIEGDRIKQVIGSNKSYQIDGEGKNGQLFIKAHDETQEPAIFSVVTEKGKTQDFKLTPKKQKGEIIIVEAAKHGASNSAQAYGIKHRIHADIVELIKKAALEPVNTEILQTIAFDNLEAKHLSTKNTGNFEVEIWQLTNTGPDTIKLDERSFELTGANIKAIGLEALELLQEQSTIMYVVRA